MTKAASNHKMPFNQPATKAGARSVATVPDRCSAGFWWVVWSRMSGFGESRASAVLAAANGALRMAAAAAKDALAAVDLLHVMAAEGSPSDPFAARDADYIRQTLPALRAPPAPRRSNSIR